MSAPGRLSAALIFWLPFGDANRNGARGRGGVGYPWTCPRGDVLDLDTVDECWSLFVDTCPWTGQGGSAGGGGGGARLLLTTGHPGPPPPLKRLGQILFRAFGR